MKAQDESSKLAAEAVLSNLRTVTAFSSQARVLQMLEKAQEGPRRIITNDLAKGFDAVGSVLVVLDRPDIMVFDDFSINIEAGKSTALVGQSGLGKSTIDGLIERLYDSLNDVVKIDGHDIRSYHLRSLRNHVALDKIDESEVIEEATSAVLDSQFEKVVKDAHARAGDGTMTNDLAKGSDAIGLVLAVLDRYSCIELDDPEGCKPDKITSHVELCDVQFAYPARLDVMIFNGFSINIEAGKSTALIVSIRDNITYGASDKINESEVIEVAKAANAHDFIACLEDG
ncbi:hypothetical protein RHGRI_022960 [Rhododendron griersonianum]|uniref:ABC transporter domain-containing protein n=1 Tax=Rhododendron griersonianum TaxID=479676 RepID=A0AAV6J6N2_9ERIC|nr:hypothetical protein RHGRI_022960 [Rhododendron griersonianum]